MTDANTEEFRVYKCQNEITLIKSEKNSCCNFLRDLTLKYSFIEGCDSHSSCVKMKKMFQMFLHSRMFHLGSV